MARLTAFRSVSLLLLVVSAGALALGAPRAPRPPPPPPPPPPQVTLELDAPLPDKHWTVKLTNTGADPVRIVADPRLLSFDVTTAGHEHQCTLPPEMVPTTDTERTLVVPASRSWTVSVDPELYCFTAAQVGALAPGASVVASFGWPQARYAPPFAVTPTTLVDGGAGPARRITATAVTIAPVQVAPAPEGGAPAVADAGTWNPPDAYPVKLRVSLGDRLDVGRAFEQTVTMTIVNDGDRPVHTLITPPTLGFIVETPNGYVVRCGGVSSVTAIVELTTTLPPHGRTAQTIDLGSTCGSAMRLPGLYRVRPRLDTRHTTPPPGATSFWTGESVGAPMLVRIRAGEDPLPSPRLDPVK